MVRTFCLAAALSAALCLSLSAQQTMLSFRGQILDGVGRPIAAAQITLTNTATHRSTTASSSPTGQFALALSPGQYRIAAEKPTFAPYAAILTLGPATPAPVSITLDLAPMQQSLVVTATSIATPQSQLGQSVEVLPSQAIQTRNGLTLANALRTLTGVEVGRSGAVGGVTSVRIRGADPSFTTILLDGVPLQRFDYNNFDFAEMTPAGIDSVTVVRGGDSVVYGSNALAGVIDIHSRSGAGVVPPELILHTVAGSFATVEQSAQLLGQWRPIDYAFTFGYLDTHNQIENDKAWNQTWAGNVGLRLPARATMRVRVRRIGSRAGVPGAYQFYGMADNSWQRQGETYASVFLQQPTTERWHNQLTFSRSQIDYTEMNVSPTGTPFDPFGFGANYLGHTVTITGANGYAVTGQAILDFNGIYPSRFSTDSGAVHAAAETSYALAPQWTIAAGYRYGQQQVTTAPRVGWHTNGLFTELSGGLWNHVFGSAGISEDLHSSFGPSFNPQASLAVLPRLSRGGFFNETRLRANAATATKFPTTSQDQMSLFTLAKQTGTPLQVGPVHPQRGHTFELGADQYVANDRARLSLTWFDNRYDDLIQFVPQSAFPLLGLPPAAAAAAGPLGGAYLNSLSETDKGMETSLDARLGSWHTQVTYTYLQPRVRKSFSSDALNPSFNPSFPGVPIGAYSPLVGARPFRVAPESGSVVVGYERTRWTAQTNLVVESRRDDSTFLSDGFFGNTLLLPNHDLAPAFTAWNLSAAYHWSPQITFEAVVENLLNRNFQEVFGYPSLGRAARVGVRFTLTPPR